MNSPKWITRTEVAKLMRKALKQQWPGQKFYVRSKSYAGGGKITVTWVDGPTEQDVKRIVGVFESAGFDSMTDCTTRNRHWQLPDGTIEIAKIGDSRGGSETYLPSQPGARRINLNSGYVDTNRRFTAEPLRKICAEVAARWGREPLDVIEADYWFGARVDWQMTGMLDVYECEINEKIKSWDGYQAK